MKKTLEQKDETLEKLVEVFGDDIDLLTFYVTWLDKGLNAKEAYRTLHPNVTEGSAEVLGSRMLGKVKPEAILQAYGLNIQVYMEQLKDGLKAIKADMVGNTYPDHKTRRAYHEVLGKALGVEKSESKNTNIQVNVTPILSELKAE